MLKKVLVGALAAVLVATGGTMAFAGNGDDGDDDGGDVIRVTVRTVTDQEIDLGPTGFGPGDRFTFFEHVFRDGERVGESGGECLIVHEEGQAATANCIATMSLPGGQLTLQGLVSFSPANEDATVAVTGGTGRYRDADGEATIEFVSDTENRFTIRLD